MATQLEREMLYKKKNIDRLCVTLNRICLEALSLKKYTRLQRCIDAPHPVEIEAKIPKHDEFQILLYLTMSQSFAEMNVGIVSVLGKVMAVGVIVVTCPTECR